ncbi:hypothetical protein [Candidatus Poriferisodalis sp.]|uniref:hypothetical protein n=1 Tax=Candidatus Poriferisodalis sp. TaxID=3101277 RepID=UPI003AF81894
MADDEFPDALPPVGEALDAAFGVQRAALRRVETSQRELQASVGELETSQRELQASVGELETSQRELQASVGEVETSQRELQASVGEVQASQRETAETLAGHSELLLGIAEKVGKLSA